MHIAHLDTMNKSIVRMDGTLAILLASSSLAHYVLCGRCTVVNSHEHERNARQLFDTAFSSALHCAAGTHKRTAVYIDRTLANLSMHLSGSLGTLPPFCYEKKTICMDGTLAIFLLRPLLICFCGSTRHGDHMTYRNDFSSKRFHLRIILKSFWDPKLCLS